MDAGKGLIISVNVGEMLNHRYKFRLRNLFMIFMLFILMASVSSAEKNVSLKYDRIALENKWKSRISAFLDKGVIPLIDLESSLKQKDGENYLQKTLPVMDRLGIALIAFDGYQAPKKKKTQKGYRWGYYIHEIVNAYPDRFILASNGGTNKNWLLQKDSFVSQTEEQVSTGDYFLMGEFDFRHYMSGHQCMTNQTDRDSDISVKSENGRRIFALSEETGVAFVIHLEPEDRPLLEIEEMLTAYPNAKIIWAHFGQIRYPKMESKFGHKLVRHLLSTYPNLYFDISNGAPGRRYKCNGNILDTVIWQDGVLGSQKNTLKHEYKSILIEFSKRFVVGTDYGGGRKQLPGFLSDRIKNIRLIMRDLPDEARHNIGYRNAWFLLTGKPWDSNIKKQN